MARVLITRDAIEDHNPDGSRVVLSSDVLSLRGRGFLRHLFKHRDAVLAVRYQGITSRPLITALLLRLISHGRAAIVDDHGSRQAVNPVTLIGFAYRFLRDFTRKNRLVRQVEAEVSQLESAAPPARSLATSDAPPVYLRSDLFFGLKSGGSVGHIAGVLNNLDQFAAPPLFFSTDTIPTVRGDIPTNIILPAREFWDFNELPRLFFTRDAVKQVRQHLGDVRPSFIYQRYDMSNYTGVILAREYGVPFVLEYNGSEVWIRRNWGQGGLRYEDLTLRIEMLNLKDADVIVVVSDPLRDELIERGIDAGKILVNPNGVDADVYAPTVDGSAVRARYGLEDKTVLGFIGTFGAWHGAEVLAEAFGRLMSAHPEYRGTTRLLMIGDGLKMPEVRAALAHHQVEALCTLTGIVPQTQGPAHLAACDMLISPHVPNADGTRFFGSPTKLFEYMAMGRGIVASDLDQIGEILNHDETAWMVKPGDPDSLVKGLKQLIDDPARRERLGAAARRDVVAHYTWREHTRKIIEKLREV